MSIAKNSEITASSSKSFEDAIRNGIKRFSKTVDNVEGAWIKEQKVKISDGEVDEYYAAAQHFATKRDMRSQHQQTGSHGRAEYR